MRLAYGPRMMKTMVQRKPMYAIIRITNACNLKCIMCSVWKRADRKKEMSLEDFERMASVLRDLNVTVINIGGGEPFVREDVADIVRIFSRKFEVRMQTNGVLAREDLVRDLRRAGLRHVSISLDTLYPDKQADICDSRNVWERIIRGMTMFSEILPRKNSLLIANTVVSKMNLGELTNLVKFTNSLGFFSGFVPVLLSETKDHDHIYRDYAPEMTITERDHPVIEEQFQKLIEMRKRGYRIFNSLDFLRKSSDFLQGRRTSWVCDAGRLYFEISPEGMFSPCSELPAVCNVLEEGFIEKFRTRMFKTDMRVRSSNCPGCMHPCWAECTQLVHDISAFREKLEDELKLKAKPRKRASYEDALSIAESLRGR